MQLTITLIARALVRTLLPAAIAAGVVNAVPAEAALTRTSCAFKVHIALSSPLNGTPTQGAFASTGVGTMDCAGWLDGALTDGTGWVEAHGSYRNGEPNFFGNPLGGFDTCALGQVRMSLFAATPVFLTFPFARSIRQLATLRLQPVARALIATGPGRVGTRSALGPGSNPVNYSGVGAFTVDRDQNCTTTPIRSGTLSEQLVVLGG